MSGQFPPAPVAFLDHDHVLRLGQSILSWEERDRAYARAFFLPEAADTGALERIGAPLRNLFGVAAVGPDAPPPEGTRVLIFRRGVVDQDLLDALPRLKLIQRLGESAHTIDLEAARKRKVAVSCLPRPTLAHVAEHVIFLALCLTRRYRLASRAFGEGSAPQGKAGEVGYNWAGIGNISTLYGKTLGIVGMGEIGVLVARRARAFGMNVVFADSAIINAPFVTALDTRQVGLGELLGLSDVVSIHVPPKPGGPPLIGVAELAAMRPGALLINTSRGVQTDEKALRGALEAGHLGGAGLDVHAHEPRGSDDPLATYDNVVLTPHIAGGSRLAVLAEISAICENIAAVLAGNPPVNGLILRGGGQ